MGKARKNGPATDKVFSLRNNGSRTRRNVTQSNVSLEDANKVIKKTKFSKNVATSNIKQKSSRKNVKTACTKGNFQTCQKLECPASTSNEQVALSVESYGDNISYQKGKSYRNIVFQLKAMETGQRYHNLQIWKNAFINTFSELNPFDIMNPFLRRVTAMSWNTKYPNFVAAGSKGGELTLINTNSLKGTETYIDGPGPGGSINSVKFDNENPSIVYTACVSGEVLCQDFGGKQNAVLLSTGSFENWFCSLDILYERKMLAAGDCKGQIYFLSTKGEKIESPKKIHKGKVSHIEICPKNSNIIVTASLDRTAKVWDLRMFSNTSTVQPLNVLTHDHPINSAYFSEANCYSLLTTDQQKEIRVYSSSTWQLQTTIYHPHRHFQHLTPIKASWYPLEDIIVVGRFPDDRFMKFDQRTIDFYDAHTGKILYKLSSPLINGISVLNNFNSTGDILVSGNGRSIVFWKNCTDFNITIPPQEENF